MWNVDLQNHDIVIDGFENGIGDSPYSGLTDMRNINTVSIPGEADVNFSTTLSSNPTFTGSITSATGSAFTYTTTTGTPVGNVFQAVTFSNISGLTGSPGISAGTVYWMLSNGLGTAFYVYTTPLGTSPVNITLTGTATFATVDMGTPRHWSYSVTSNTANVLENYLIDSNGRAWVNVNGQSGWTFLGNTLYSDSYGNGLVWYEGANPPTNTVTTKGAIVSSTFGGATGTNALINYTQTSGFAAPTDGQMVSFISPGGSLHLPAGIVNSTYWIGNVTATTFNIFTDPALTKPLYIPNYAGTIVSASSVGNLITTSVPTGGTYPVQHGDPIIFTGNSLPGGLVQGATYYVGTITGNPTTAPVFPVYIDSLLTTQVPITGTGTGSFASTGTGTFTNYTTTEDEGYLFVFRGSAIDYMRVASRTWVYNWWPPQPSYALAASPYLNTPAGVDNSHYALVGQDNAIYYCDGNFVGSIIQTNPANYPFDPTNPATYGWTQQALELPSQDNTTWLAELGPNLLVSGIRNYIYPWDRTVYLDSSTGISYTQFSQPILIAESNTTRMITVNTNTYIFAGNRGRIYVTNGSQAELFKKIPDHLSGTVEPYYVWGAIGYSQNQLYFGFQAQQNNGSILQSGGLWALDITTGALRLANILSYGTYNGYATVFIPNPPQGATLTPGSAFFVGWYNGTSGGIDVSSSTVYTGGQSYVISDMIPIGTAIEPITPAQFEFKLATPLLTGESVKLQVASSINGSFSDLVSTAGTASTAGDGSLLSDIYSNTTQLNQWILLKCILTGIGSSPSYNRLTQLRIKGATKGITGYSAPE